MGYDVHITRKEDWSDEQPEISLAEWLAVVQADPEMRLDGDAEARTAADVIRIESSGLSVWTAYSRHGEGGNMAWFDFRGGNAVVKNPDKEILRKMWVLAQRLSAKVQGDDGETYDAAGNPTE
jgi:prepilin-type processing-associated H-X9-DG protein